MSNKKPVGPAAKMQELYFHGKGAHSRMTLKISNPINLDFHLGKVLLQSCSFFLFPSRLLAPRGIHFADSTGMFVEGKQKHE